MRFKDAGTRDFYRSENTKAARSRVPASLAKVARRKLDYVLAATELLDLRSPPGNRLEALRGERLGQYSIRINEQYRICFEWTAQGAKDVEIVDYH
jgi:proteic killer suppression protein